MGKKQQPQMGTAQSASRCCYVADPTAGYWGLWPVSQWGTGGEEKPRLLGNVDSLLDAIESEKIDVRCDEGPNWCQSPNRMPSGRIKR